MGSLELGPVKELTPVELRDLLANERRCTLVYDIETGPADEKTIRSFFKEDQVKLPKHPGEFDPHAVKYGNTKDPAKRRAKLEEEMAKHRLALSAYIKECEQAKHEAWESFVSGAALQPTIGRVYAIGYGLVRPEGLWYCLDASTDEGGERNLLRRHWLFVELLRKRTGKLVSFNGHRFDYPFLRRRSWAYDDVPPPNLVTKYRKMEDFCIDILEAYRSGGGWNESISLDDLGKMLGVGGKMVGMTGAHFYEVWKVDRQKALDYLARDIELTFQVGRRMELA